MSKHSSLPYRPDIDGLRALAVTLVLIFHVNASALRGGFVGVDVFFVISGYLIFAITRRELADRTFSLVQFYGRRIRRLFPALMLMLVTVLAVGWFILSAEEYALLGGHVAAGVLYVSNFAYWREAGYFDAASELKPLLHLWSLAIEEQFYLVWPVFAAWLVRSGRGELRWILGLTLASLVGGLIATSMNRTVGFYLSPVRFWEILGGCLLALEVTGPRWRRFQKFAAPAGLLLIVGAAVSFTGSQRYPGSRALAPTLGAMLIIGAGPATWFNRRVLAARWAVHLGKISYPLYLWHWPVIVVLRLLAPGWRDTPAGQIAAVGLALTLAQLSYALVERPARTIDARGRAWWMMAPWLALGLTGGIIKSDAGFPNRTPALNAQLASVGARDQAYYKNENCPATLRASAALKFCRQARPGRPTHAVIGDSHANHVFEGVAHAIDQNWLVLGNQICAPTLGVRMQTGPTECEAGLRQMLDYVRDQDSIHTVVLSFYGQYASLTDASAQHRRGGGGPASFVIGEHGLSEEQRFAVFETGLENVIREVEALHRRLVLAYDVPELPFFPQDCIRRPWALETPVTCAQSRAAVTERQAPYRAMVASLLKRHPKLSTYDPLPRLCDARSCWAGDDQGPFYFDSHHVGDRGSQRAFAGLTGSI